MVDEVKPDAQVSPEEQARLEAVVKTGHVADPNVLAKAAAAEQQKKDEEAAAKDLAKQAEELAAKKSAEQPKKTDEADPNSWKEQWVRIGNVHADAAIELMQKTGMTPVEGNAVFEEAIKTGDLTKVKWEVLEARLGKSTAALVKVGIDNYYNSEYSQQKELINYAHEKTGGEKGWSAIQEWAKSKESSDPAFQKELNEWRQAIKVGGFAARAAVDVIKSRYEADPSNKSLSTALERGNTPSATLGEGAPLSRAAYFKELDKAGGDRAPQAIQKALYARRQAGVKAGL